MTSRTTPSRPKHPVALRIGISGWRYAPWRGSFYPDDLTQNRELAWASRQFCSIELNGSFYSLQTPARYRRWRDDTPQGFVFSVKAPRYITHTGAACAGRAGAALGKQAAVPRARCSQTRR
ncbi:FIG003003: hypothetical protein [plant metagenome]|uniref:DUF72 domain-containing protein n=1 Tax=plant metagenome TaxID=1297885 RepID=A0A484SQW0_9ZZZZ